MMGHAHSTEEAAVSARAHSHAHRSAGQRASTMSLSVTAVHMTVERVERTAADYAEDHHVGHLVVHWRAEG